MFLHYFLDKEEIDNSFFFFLYDKSKSKVKNY